MSESQLCEPQSDEYYMRRAISLAWKGLGWTNPNPMVGAVIVKNGRIIGEGYHEKCGQLHAERNAIASLTESAEGATIYVTLEPCCHYGKTPPCTEAILENKLARVVIGSRDPNPKVAGKGAAMLRKAGIQVEEDFLREECDRLNPVFFHYITTKTPYVVQKYAMTADGKIATVTGESKWITGEAARAEVHKMRHRYMGIMAGIGTVLADDPMLNTRIPGGKSPIRILADSHLRIPLNSQLVQSAHQYRTMVACLDSLFESDNAASEKANLLKEAGIEILPCPEKEQHIDLSWLMKALGEQGIDSILLEGGAELNEAALRAGIVSELNVFIAPKIFGGNAKSPVGGAGILHPSDAYLFTLQDFTRAGDDLWICYQAKRSKTSCSPQKTLQAHMYTYKGRSICSQEL